jgi:hypothetical protein
MSAHLMMLRCCSDIGCFFGGDLMKAKQQGKGPAAGEK